MTEQRFSEITEFLRSVPSPYGRREFFETQPDVVVIHQDDEYPPTDPDHLLIILADNYDADGFAFELPFDAGDDWEERMIEALET